MKTLDELIEKAIDDNMQKRLALGFLRYEAVRKLDARQYTDLQRRSLNGERFDKMIDELIIKNER